MNVCSFLILVQWNLKENVKNNVIRRFKVNLFTIEHFPRGESHVILDIIFILFNFYLRVGPSLVY
jgi:hypothetical protein